MVRIKMTKAKIYFLIVICALLSLSSILTLYYTHQIPTEEERLLTLCTYAQVGKYNYTAKLKPNFIYNQSTLKPGEGILYMKITELIDTNFFYTFRLSGLDRPANITIDYSIDACLESPQWRKRINIVPKSILNSTGATAYLSTNYLVNISSVEETYEVIQSETGSYSSTYNLTITPEIHTVAITDVETIDEYFTPSMTITFMYSGSEGNTILIEGLTHTSPGAITRTEKIYKPSVMKQRYTSYAFSITSFSSLAYTSSIFIKNKPRKIKNPLEEIIEQFEEILVEIVEEPTYDEKRVTMKTLEDLVKLAEGLEKPVFHSESARSSREKEQTHTFYVLDGGVRYEFTIEEMVEAQKMEEEKPVENSEKPKLKHLECPYFNIKGEKCRVVAFSRTEASAYKKLEAHIAKKHPNKLNEFKEKAKPKTVIDEEENEMRLKEMMV